MNQEIIEFLHLSAQAREMHRDISERLLKHDLTPAEASIITVVNDSSCTELAVRLDTTLPRITTLVKNLKYRGLLNVKKKGTTHIVSLTARGQELLNKIEETS